MASRWRGGNRTPGDGRLSGEERIQRRLHFMLQEVYDHLDRGRPDRAFTRLEDVARGLRDRPDYLVARAETLFALGQRHQAWQEIHSAFEEQPNQPAIAFTLGSISLRLGLNPTAYHTLSRFQELADRDPFNLKPAIEALEELEDYLENAASSTHLSKDAFLDAGLLNDEGQVEMGKGEFETALSIFNRAREKAPQWAGPRNNRCLCLYYLGKVDQAIEEADSVLEEIDPQNTHALANLCQFLAAIGRREEAEPYLERLRSKHPEERHSLVKRIYALGYVEDSTGLLAIARDLPEETDLPPNFDGACYYLLGSGAANEGEYELARSFFERAREAGDPLERADQALKSLDQHHEDPRGPGLDGRFPYVHYRNFISGQVIDELLDVERLSPSRRDSTMRRLGERYPQLVAVGEKMILDEGQVRAGVDFLSVLDRPAGYAAIHRFATSKYGSFEERIGAFQRLKEAGELPPAATTQIWDEDQGDWRDVEIMGWELREEPPDPPEMAESLNEVRDLFAEGDYDTAQRRLDQLWDKHHGQPVVALLYGELCMYLGDLGRAEDWFRRALQEDPEYHLARVELASLLATSGEEQAAVDELAHVGQSERLSFPALAGYLKANVEIAIERKEYESAEESIRRLEEVFPESQWPEFLREDVNRARFHNRWLKDVHRYHHRKRGQVIAPDAKLITCLDRISREALVATARTWGVSSSGRKAELIERLGEVIFNPDQLNRQVQSLHGDEQEALKAVLDAGGSMPWDPFRERFGDDIDESPYWQWHDPETVPGVLRMMGLLAIGTHQELVIVVVPEDLRRPLQKVLESRTD